MVNTLLKTSFNIERKCEAFFTCHQIEITKNGDYMFCQCSDAVSYVKVDTGEVIDKITIEEDEVSCISLSPNDASFILALRSSSIQHYEYKDVTKCPQLLRSFKSYHQGPIQCMAWDSTSTLLASGSSDGSARIWDVEQKFCTHSLKGASGVFRLISFDNLTERPWVYGACGINIYIWLLEAGSSKLVSTLESHHSPVTGMQLCASRNKLVSCGLDRVIILWDLNDFAPIKIIPVYESLSGLVLKPSDVSFFNFDDENELNYAMVIGDKGVPSLWEVDTGKEVWKASEPLVPPTDQEGVTLVNQMSIIPSLQSIVFTTFDNAILFAHYKSMHVWKQLCGFNEQIIDVVFVGTNNSHLVAATNSPQLRIYNVLSFDCKLVKGHSGIVMALVRHPTHADLFASSSSDNTARIWRLLSNGSACCVAVASGHTHSVGSLALADSFLITGSKDTCIKKWMIDEKLLNTLLNSYSFTNLSSSMTERAHTKDINSICISRNNKFVATGSQDKIAKVYDASSLSILGVLEGHRRGIWCCQFSPVDQILATASADGTIKIWTLSNFTNAMTLEGHQVSVLRFHFITNGLQIISSGGDGLLKLWNVKNGTCINTLDGHDSKTWALAVTGEAMECGSRIVSGGEDAALIWWRDVTVEEKTKLFAEQEKLTAQEQTLLNLIHEKKWRKAFKIAIALSQPFRALKIAKQILDESPEEFPLILRKLKEHETASLLEFVVQWNTKARDVREAQAVLSFLLSEKLPSELESISGFTKALEGLIPYTERHYKRVEALHQASYIVDYIVQCGGVGLTSDGKTISNNTEEQSLLMRISKTSMNEISHDHESEKSDDDMSVVDTGGQKGMAKSVDDLEANFEIEDVRTDSSEDSDSELSE